MNTKRPYLITLLFMLGCFAVQADTIPFLLQAQTELGPVTGLLHIDTDVGTVIDADVSFGLYHFTGLQGQTDCRNHWPDGTQCVSEIQLHNWTAPETLPALLYIEAPVQSFVGYTGGVLCGSNNADAECPDWNPVSQHQEGVIVSKFYLLNPEYRIGFDSASLVPKSGGVNSPVPEPASWMLFISGLALISVRYWRKERK